MRENWKKGKLLRRSAGMRTWRIINAIKIFTEAAETNGEPSVLEAYMANVALLTDQDSEKDEDRNKVT